MPLIRLLLGALLVVSVVDATERKRPNIVLIVTDDLGFGDVGVLHQNGRSAANDRHQPFFRTPQLDRLAAEGLNLRTHYSAAPVCAPSRASLLTGRTQGHASVRDNQFDRALGERITLASVLHAAGYATAAIGKWGLQGGAGETNPPRGRSEAQKQAEYDKWTGYPTRRGFDYFYGYVRHRDGHFHYPAEDGREIWENDREVSAGLELCYTTDLFTAQAKRWIAAQQASQPGQPFFLYLAFDTPHAVLANPPCAYPAGGGLRGGVQWTGQLGAMLNTATGTRDGWMHPDFAEATWDHDGDPATAERPWPDIQRRHANAVRRIDQAVGDLLQLLADLGAADDTLVVFTSDNGPAQESYLPETFRPDFFRGFGPHSGIKRDLLEGGVRVPALVRWPAAVPAGRTSEWPTGQWDWLATFAEAAGVPVPASADGVSLLPLLTGQEPQAESTIYAEYFNPQPTPNYAAFPPEHRRRPRGQMQLIVLDGYKGLRTAITSAEDMFAIYDVRADPAEADNLALRPGFEALQQRMQQRVLQLRRPDPTAPRPYDAALVPPVGVPEQTGSLAWTSYKGEWPWLPDLRRLTPTAKGLAPHWDVTLLPADTPGAIAFNGLVYIRASGAYSFSFVGQGEAMLFLHEIRVLDSAAESEGTVRLAAGWHPLRLLFRSNGRPPSLDLSVRDEQGRPVAFTSAHFAPPPLP